jgi:hypothetical protein
MTSKPQSVSETVPYLGILGDEPVLETTSDMSLLSTKKVVHMIKKDLLADAFLLLIRHDDSLKGISDNESFDRADGTSGDPFAKFVPGNSKAKKDMKDLVSHHDDLFKIELPGVTQLKNTRSVIPLVPVASIPNRPMFRCTQTELAEIQTQVTDLLKHGLIQKSTSPFGAPVIV